MVLVFGWSVGPRGQQPASSACSPNRTQPLPNRIQPRAAPTPDGGLALSALGKLPAIRGADDDEVDTDGDAGSEATDMEESE